jgi:hypothetical protein
LESLRVGLALSELFFGPEVFSPHMSFGFKSNVRVGDVVYHVQTEQGGEDGAVLDTVVYIAGRVIHRVKTNICDDAPAGLSDDGARADLRDGEARDDSALSVGDRVERQHKDVIAQLESGALPRPLGAEPGSTK